MARGESLVTLVTIAATFALVFGALLYAAIAAARLGMTAFGDLAFVDAVNPFRWSPTWLSGWAIALVAIEAILFFIMRDSLWLRRVDSNVYFNELVDYGGEPLPTFVVHSGQLDEALLGLTVRPLLDTALNPVVGDVVDQVMGRARVHPRWIEPVAGDPAQLSHGFRSLVRGIGFLLRAAANRGFAWILNPVNRTMKRRLRGAVLSVAELAALGLPASEARFSTIEVSELPELPGLLDLRSCDASRDLLGWSADERREAMARDESQSGGATNRSRDFEFLWNQEAMAKQAESSDAWQRVRADLDRLLREYPTTEPDRFRQRLQRSVLTIEQRIREVTGAVSLEHSAYYEHPAVVDAVAEFLSESEDRDVGRAAGNG